MKKYTALLVLLTIILGAVIHIAKTQLFDLTIGKFLTIGLGYFFALIMGGHVLLTKSKKGRPQGFINAFMGFTAVKMFLTLTVIAVYVYLFRGGYFVIYNAVIFTGMYFVYTVFESIYLLTHNKTP